VIPKLLLLLMPLSFGLVGCTDSGAWTGLARGGPALFSQPTAAEWWFSRGLGSALLPELYRWIFLFPILTAVLSTLGAVPESSGLTSQGDHAQAHLLPAGGLFSPPVVLACPAAAQPRPSDPRARRRAPIGPDQAASSRAAPSLGLVWASISVATLSVALAPAGICAPAGEATPWFAVGFASGAVCARPLACSGRLMAIRRNRGLELACCGQAALMPGLRGCSKRPAAVGMAGPLPFPLPRAHRHGTQRQRPPARRVPTGMTLTPRKAKRSQSLALTDALASGRTRQAPFSPWPCFGRFCYRRCSRLAAQVGFQRSLMPLDDSGR